MPSKVLIFTKRVLPRSNTFVAAQGNNIPSFEPIYIGLRNNQTGIDLIKGKKTCVQENVEPVPSLSRLLLDGLQLLTPAWETALRDQKANLIHANFGKGGYYCTPLSQKLDLPLITTFHGSDITQKDKFSYNTKHRNITFKHSNNQNLLTIKGDATNSILLQSVGINSHRATTIIAITEDDAVNLSIILTTRSLNPSIRIVARANDKRTREKLLLAGATEVILSNERSALVASEYVGQPVAFEAIDDILLNSEGAIMEEIEILGKSNFIGYYIEDINLDKFHLTLIGVIQEKDRKKFIFNPQKNSYKILKNDIFIIIGNKESISQLKIDLLSTKPKRVLNA